MTLRNSRLSGVTMCDISSRSYTHLENQIFYCLVCIQGIMAGTGAELLLAAIAQGNGHTEDEVLFQQPLYFIRHCLAKNHPHPT